jgi:hypothetical protein
MLVATLWGLVNAQLPAQFGPSAQAVALQQLISRSLAASATSLAVPPGDYYFGNASLLIHRASRFALRARDGPGTVQLWFAVGAGVLVNQSSNVVLDGLSLDYDPPAHFQGTVVQVIDGGGGGVMQALVRTDPGFMEPGAFDAAYRQGVPGVQSPPGPALLWNASDPGFGSYAAAVWPPAAAEGAEPAGAVGGPAGIRGAGFSLFNVSRAAFCTDINAVTTDGTSCLAGVVHEMRPGDKVTCHTRTGFTLHLLNSSRVRTQNTAIHGAPGFALTEYDGNGGHSYFNVTVGRRHAAAGAAHTYDADAMCGTTNPTGGRLCLGMIASNNDALHSSGCKYGPVFSRGELSYALDDWINIHSRAQVVLERTDARHLVVIDPRLKYAVSVPDDFPYGNAETLTNARPRDPMSFYASGNLTLLGSATLLSARRASWKDDAALISRAQQLLDGKFNRTCGLDAGPHCRVFGCDPRVWHLSFDADLPDWSDAPSADGAVASLDSWRASGAVVEDSYLHHGRFGVRWKSSDARITGNRISARYMELSPLEYYMEGPFRLSNLTVANNTFASCAAPATSFAPNTCDSHTHLPLGYWRQWVSYGGGCGGVCKAASVGASQLDAAACTDVTIEQNVVS